MARHGVTDFLRAFEDVGATFFDLETDLLIVLDARGNIERVNPAFERMLGYTEKEVLGAGIARLIRLEDWAAFFRTFTTVNPAPVRLMRKGSGDVGVKMIACRFKAHKGYMVLRPIGMSDYDV